MKQTNIIYPYTAKILKITILLVSIVARNSMNFNLVCQEDVVATCMSYYDFMYTKY